LQGKHEANQKANSTQGAQAEKTAYLVAHEFFHSLSSEEIGELERITTLHVYPAGHIIYRPGEKGTALFLLKDGHVQLYHLSTDGRKLIIATLEAGASFGEMILIGPHRQDCFAETVTSAGVFALNIHDLEQLFIRKPAVMQALLQKIGQRLIGLESQLVDTTFKSVLARLASLLLHLAEVEDDKTGLLVVTGLSHEELADRLGVYRETVSSTLRELKEAGAIELGRKHITVCNLALLEDIAAFPGKTGRI
jgi:CRP/FNR family cyclic AMP-dependent transcriptional regulator